MDVQFIGEYTMVITKYITKYTTKSEKLKTQDLWQAVNKSCSLNGQMLSLTLRLLRSREVDVYEVCDKLSGHPLHKSNVLIDFLYTNDKKNRRRHFIDKQQLDELDPSSGHFFKNNFVDTYYPRRPDELDDKSLYYVFSWYNYQRERPVTMSNKNDERHYELSDDLGHLIKRLKPRWIKTYLPRPDSPTATEDYFRRLLFMFVPWRDEDVDLLGSCNSFYEAYEKISNIVKADAEAYLAKRRRLDEATEMIRKLREERVAEAENASEPADCLPVNVDDQFDGLFERSVQLNELFHLHSDFYHY